jgi:hypothetical protein
MVESSQSDTRSQRAWNVYHVSFASSSHSIYFGILHQFLAASLYKNEKNCVRLQSDDPKEHLKKTRIANWEWDMLYWSKNNLFLQACSHQSLPP